MSLSSAGPTPAYGWQHAAFVLGLGALLVFLALGLTQAFAEQGRPPGVSLDLYAQGQALEARGELQKAIGEYEMALRISVGDAQPAKRLAQAALRAGDIEAEIRARRAIAQLAPRDPDAQLALGAVLLRVNRPAESAEAATAFRRALVADPRNGALHNNLGIALAQSGNAQEAVNEFEAGLALAPDPSLRRNLEQARAQLVASRRREEAR